MSGRVFQVTGPGLTAAFRPLAVAGRARASPRPAIGGNQSR